MIGPVDHQNEWLTRWTGRRCQYQLCRLTYINCGFDHTPNIAQLATHGMRFSRAYATSPICGPSRNSIMTGRDTINTNHFKLENYKQCCNGKNATHLLPIALPNATIHLTHESIPEYLKKSTVRSYKSAHFGKWHLDSNPGDHGFDYHDGDTENIEGNQCETTRDMVKNGTFPNCDAKMMVDITEKGRVFMTQYKDTHSFYLQLSHYAVHGKSEFSKPFYDLHKERWSNFYGKSFGAMTSQLDAQVGETVSHVQALGITSKTFIMYTSDNGGVSPDGTNNNAPLKGGKRMLWEGGLRVPFIVKGPGVVPGVTNDVVVTHADILPTVFRLAGGKAKDRAKDLDGTELSLLLTGNKTTKSKKYLTQYFYFPHYETRILSNDVTDTIETANGSSVAAMKPSAGSVRQDGANNWKFIINMETGTRELYDLSADIGESDNKADANTAQALSEWRGVRDHLWKRNATYPRLNGGGDDVDGDGLPDAWEFQNLLTTAYNGTSDPDGDGVTVAREFSNHTDPLGGSNMPYVVPTQWNQNSYTSSEHPTFYMSGMGYRTPEIDPRVIVKVRSAALPGELLKCTLRAPTPINLNDVHTLKLQDLGALGKGKYLVTLRQLPAKEQVSRLIEILDDSEKDSATVSCVAESLSVQMARESETKAGVDAESVIIKYSSTLATGSPTGASKVVVPVVVGGVLLLLAAAVAAGFLAFTQRRQSKKAVEPEAPTVTFPSATGGVFSEL